MYTPKNMYTKHRSLTVLKLEIEKLSSQQTIGNN